MNKAKPLYLLTKEKNGEGFIFESHNLNRVDSVQYIKDYEKNKSFLLVEEKQYTEHSRFYINYQLLSDGFDFDESYKSKHVFKEAYVLWGSFEKGEQGEDLSLINKEDVKVTALKDYKINHILVENDSDHTKVFLELEASIRSKDYENIQFDKKVLSDNVDHLYRSIQNTSPSDISKLKNLEEELLFYSDILESMYLLPSVFGEDNV